MNGNGTLHARLTTLQKRALLAGVIGLAGFVIASILSGAHYMESYLFAYMFWLEFGLGCLGVLMLHHMTSGSWGHVIQRVNEASLRTLPFLAVLFIPVLLGMERLYPWIHPEQAGRELHIWPAYLNVPFFIVRAVLYFIVWIVMGHLLVRWSRAQDRTADPRLTRTIRLLSAPGLIVYVLTMTFAAVDWLMSLEPEWHSTVYGFLIVVSQVLASLALAIVLLRVMSGYRPLSDVVTGRDLNHLGNLLLTFVVLWAYMSYSQLIIIWSGNLPDENSWYLSRIGAGWSLLALIIVVVHFFIPFFLLLVRRLKRSARALARIAGLVIAMRLVESFWLVMPAFRPDGFRVEWTDVFAPLAIGGFWVALFVWYLKDQPVLPLHDPRFVPVVEEAEA